MDVFHLSGGGTLGGTIPVSGSKNAVLPILAACLLTSDECVIDNVPNLSDVRYMTEMLGFLGASVSRPTPNRVVVRAETVGTLAPYDLVRKMRASICLLGAMVGRTGQATVSLPGGCVIGPRPIDLHLKGLRRLGCRIEIDAGYIHVDASSASGSDVFLGGRYGSTVTGTANMLMTAVLTPGITRIECAACEPEIADLCRMLIKMGANIEGVGSPTLIIAGVKRLNGVQHTVIPDRIEAGTYLIAGVFLRSPVEVVGCPAEYLGALLDKMDEAGALLEAAGDKIAVIPTDQLKPVDLITLPHPGFPTDLQAQFTTLLSTIRGISIITERIYPNRFMHIPELQRMGADIAIEGSSAIVKGVSHLSGAPVMASDLRASAALVLAGLAARGDTWIQRIYHLDRGYEGMDGKLRALGARIERLPASEMPNELRAEP